MLLDFIHSSSLSRWQDVPVRYLLALLLHQQQPIQAQEEAWREAVFLWNLQQDVLPQRRDAGAPQEARCGWVAQSRELRFSSASLLILSSVKAMKAKKRHVTILHRKLLAELNLDCFCIGPKHMKREEPEANGEEGTKYRKEPSPCPICGKVSPLHGSRSNTCTWIIAQKYFISDVCVHRCSPAGVTWTSTCWLTVIRSTPVRSAPASSSAWTSFEITFTFTSRWAGAQRRLFQQCWTNLQNNSRSWEFLIKVLHYIFCPIMKIIWYIFFS